MPSIQVPAASADLTANGDTTKVGYVTVTSNAGFYPGCEAWLCDTDGSQRCLITDISGTTLIGIQFLPEELGGRVPPAPNYHRNGCSAFTTAKSSRINMPAQVAPIDPSFAKRISVLGL